MLRQSSGHWANASRLHQPTVGTLLGHSGHQQLSGISDGVFRITACKHQGRNLEPSKHVLDREETAVPMNAPGQDGTLSYPTAWFIPQSSDNRLLSR